MTTAKQKVLIEQWLHSQEPFVKERIALRFCTAERVLSGLSILENPVKEPVSELLSEIRSASDNYLSEVIDRLIYAASVDCSEEEFVILNTGEPEARRFTMYFAGTEEEKLIRVFQAFCASSESFIDLISTFPQ